MAELAIEPASHENHRQNALAEIHFADLIDADLTPSEDETPDEKELQLETVQSAIGVSIGEQQTRLNSPKTPAAEKAAALDDVDGGGLFDGWEQQAQDTSEQSGPQPALHHGRPEPVPSRREDEVREKAPATPTEPPARLPSPWRAGPKEFKKADGHRAALRDNLNTKSRRRTMSGTMSDSVRKYMPFNLPSMPKSGMLNFSLPSLSVSSLDHMRGRQPPQLVHHKHITSLQRPKPYANIVQNDGSSQSQLAPCQSLSRSRSRSRRSSYSLPRHPATAPLPQSEFAPSTEEVSTPHATPDEITRRPTPVLRRSNSEGSLLVYRSRSIASSLGDDTRFEHVSEQVNSRLKAIKDSWQDSNFRLSVPSMPNFSFGTREDLFRSKNGTTTPRALDGDSAISHSISFLANNSSSSSRRSSAMPPKARAAQTSAGGNPSNSTTTHPYFMRALHELEGDLVVLGGYRGSVLRSAEPPNRQVWVPLKVGLNLRKVDLEIGLDPADEENMEERIIPGGMLTHIGPVDIAKRLFKRLRASENARTGLLRVHDYGYDWRLSPHLLGRRMIRFLESLPCNQPGVPSEKRGATVIAHSLGGLITRHVINQRPELISGVVYAGVPQHCINILGPLRNGDDVLLSSRVLTAQVNFTIRTSFALLPLDGKCFINKKTKEEYRIDFFDSNTWEKYRLSPCIAPALPLPQPTTSSSNLSVSGLLNAMSQALPSLPGRKGSFSKGTGTGTPNHTRPDSADSPKPGSNPAPSTLDPGAALKDTARNAADKATQDGAQASGVAPKMEPNSLSHTQAGPSTTVTLPHDKAVAYLTRTLAETKKFKQELDHCPEHTATNAYPPIALIYGKSTPTVYGAKVDSREAIQRLDAYHELTFASGDGVVLARSAMVPKGYSVVRGGVVASERGHVTLLGDLEAVGKCLLAVIGARRDGIGRGEGVDTKMARTERAVVLP